MRLSLPAASPAVLALVAAVPPPRPAAAALLGHPFAPPPPSFSNVSRCAIWAHLNLAERVINHITYAFPFVQPDLDFDAPMPHDRHAAGAEPAAVVRAQNFVRDVEDGRNVHVLCKDAPGEGRLLALTAFLGTIDALLYTGPSQTEQLSEGRVLALQDDELGAWLRAVSRGLLTAVRLKFNEDARNRRFLWFEWLNVVKGLDKAIGFIQIYDNEPLAAHGNEVIKLINMRTEFDQAQSRDLVLETIRRFETLEINVRNFYVAGDPPADGEGGEFGGLDMHYFK